jgi:hypothetical protein
MSETAGPTFLIHFVLSEEITELIPADGRFSQHLTNVTRVRLLTERCWRGSRP